MKQWHKNFIYFIYLILISTIGIFLSMEFYCRAKGIGRLSNFRYTDWPNMEIFKTSNYLPFEIVPNIKGRTNSLGMRDKEYEIRKAPGIYRIVVLGDSITMYGEYTDYLEEELNKNFGNRFEVWNCAIGGQGVREYYYNLLYRCLNYKPDLIIIGFCLNDFKPTPVIFKTKDGLHCYRQFLIFKSNFDNWFFCHSYAYRFFMLKIEKLLAGKKAGDLDEYGRKYLRKIKEIALYNKVPLLSVIFPYFRVTSEDTNQYRVIKKLIKEFDIDSLDLHEVFPRSERKNFVSPFDKIHPDARAHKIAALAIMEYLRQNKLFNGIFDK